MNQNTKKQLFNCESVLFLVQRIMGVLVCCILNSCIINHSVEKDTQSNKTINSTRLNINCITTIYSCVKEIQLT